LLIGLSLVTALLCPFPANAQTFATQDVMIPFAQKDGSVLQLDTMIFIPEGQRRFPLAIVSHGSPRSAYARPGMSPSFFTYTAQWLVNLGFAVAIPMRRGYGKSQGTWAEGFGPCKDPDYVNPDAPRRRISERSSPICAARHMSMRTASC
jgi:predicted acyl esterase